MNKKIEKIVSTILLGTMFTYTVPAFAYTKEESVYAKLDANGKAYQTTVSDHLKNTEKQEFLQDFSDLMNIENVSGNQELVKENDALTWKAEGSDIYYQGKTDKTLPIECKVTYTLDGKEISKEDIVGKKGQVKITLTFTNNEKRQVNIQGKTVDMYVPFIVGVGTIINNENNRNIEITNGKQIDNGTKTMVFGISLPGMQESLGISKNKVEIPNQVEISMETENFESNAIYIFATPKILENSDLEALDKLDDFYNKMNTLQTSTNQIEEGASTLKQGTETYYEKSQEFNNAMEQITSGVNSANKNYNKINDGINTIKENSTILNNGAKAVSDGADAISTNLAVVNENLGLLQQGGKELQQGEKELSNGIDDIINSVSQTTKVDNSAKIKQLQELVKNNNKTINALTSANEQLNKSLESLPTIKENEAQIQSIQTQIATNKTIIELLKANNGATNQTIQTLEATDSSMEQLEEGLGSLKEGINKLEAGTSDLNEGLEAVQTGTKTLAEKSQELANGGKALYDGTEQLQEGTKTLSSGSAQIKAGLNTLDSGSSKLQEASESLEEGAGTIKEGANALSDGITKLNSEGIKVLYNTINGEVKNLQVRLEKLEELANDYNSFTMIDENTNGNVKFIMMIDSLKVEPKEEVSLPKKEEE